MHHELLHQLALHRKYLWRNDCGVSIDAVSAIRPQGAVLAEYLLTEAFQCLVLRVRYLSAGSYRLGPSFDLKLEYLWQFIPPCYFFGHPCVSPCRSVTRRHLNMKRVES